MIYCYNYQSNLYILLKSIKILDDVIHMLRYNGIFLIFYDKDYL
jgi:hypothetical protein